ncbi:hypothetical protein, partial [Rubripirellula amarantea]|uniref:hypothetical protein n=1 Tax=Rubripirellula amarantea TaxID=2527999 RepID=UPI0011B7CCB5
MRHLLLELQLKNAEATALKQSVAPRTLQRLLEQIRWDYVEDHRFGPLSKHLLHTSFGKGWMSYLMIQDVGDLSQAAIVKLPFNFATGIMRGRVNPKDG